MINKYIIVDQSAKHFVTFCIVKWIDVFTRQEYKNRILQSFNFCQQEMGLLINGYVIMPNHVHAILQSSTGTLSKTITSFKKFTGLNIINDIHNNHLESRKEWMLHELRHQAIVNNRNSDHQLWKTGNRPMEIYTGEFFWQKLNYIHGNPVRAGIVDLPEHYVYSSAGDYMGKPGKLKIDLVDWVRW